MWIFGLFYVKLFIYSIFKMSEKQTRLDWLGRQRRGGLRAKSSPRQQESPPRAGVNLPRPLTPGTGSQGGLEMERDGKGEIGPLCSNDVRFDILNEMMKHVALCINIQCNVYEYSVILNHK